MQIKKDSQNKLTLVIAMVILLAGIYLLYLVLTPFLRGAIINPTDNPTIQQLSKQEKITEDRLYIPKIDINLPYKTGGEEVMENDVLWRLPQNGNPRDGGNFVLSAHRFVMGFTPEQTWRKSPFYNINKLDNGDEIVVDYQGQRYNYIIDQKLTVRPEAIEIEDRTDEPQLTIYTCTLGGADDGREVIIAKPKK